MKAQAKVSNLLNSNNRAAANQFIIESTLPEGNKTVTFQSYKTTIAVEIHDINNFGVVETVIDIDALNYSRTTSKYLFIFLGLNRKEIETRVKEGLITVKDLN